MLAATIYDCSGAFALDHLWSLSATNLINLEEKLKYSAKLARKDTKFVSLLNEKSAI